ncbi:uncharacterized protein C12orf56-like isoform X1 [Haliotis rufescens]|uniref:uncharacterized protein C12orf56-like isoform X1 n=1 Tax=Haliotis rufescens TaxID=6454 RepID=UPI001EB03806|nr:uncharacterized protein C12orf56-like isoform X1 [Haliotis rufescens]
MARSSADLLTKTNSKLESFLKRAVSEETYERIRAYESCIVVSERENKAFKYIVLGDEWIYLTENPPKGIQETVPLKDIVSVELVNEYPDFLTGAERENTQHITITYLTSDHRKRSRRRSKKTGSLSELSLDRSNASTPLGYAESVESFSEDYGYTTQSTCSLQTSRPNSRGSVASSWNTTSSISKKKKKQLNDSLDHDSILRSLKEELEEDLDTDDRLATIHSVPSSSKGARSHSKSPRTSKPNSASKRPLPSPRSSPADTTVSTKEPKSPPTNMDSSETYTENDSSTCGCTTLMCRGRNKNQVVPVVNANSAQMLDHKGDVISVRSDKRQLVPEIEVETDSVVMRSSSPSIQHFSVSRLSIDGSVRGSRSGTPDLARHRSSSILASTSDLGDSMTGLNLVGSEGGLTEKRRTLLHVYLLNLTSPMLMLIRSAWNNYLIRCTLLIDPEMEKVAMSTAIRGPQGKRLVNREKTELLFNQLKRELFNAANTMEELYSLLIELKAATEKNFSLKKLFWRNSDLFLFMVRHLQKYLPKSPSNLSTDEGRSARADEFEFVILLVEILSLMFRETEIIQGRIQTLKAERGKAVLDLLMALTCVPDLPDKPLSPKKTMKSGIGDQLMERVSDEDLARLVDDLTKMAIKAVFELFLMARQANWNHSEGNFFNISWMVRVLEEIRTTEKFVERVIAQMMELISPAKFDTLAPEEGVALYQQFSLLLTFLEYSPRITKFIKQQYHEEFKYFIQVPKVARKLPPQYPVSSSTRNIMDQVIAKVLSHSRSSSRSPR